MLLRIGVFAVLAAATFGAAAPAGADEEAAAVVAQPASDATSASAGNPQRGRRAFQRYCSVCHGARGEGGAGPPLQGISTRMAAGQIEHQIIEPRGSMPRLYPSPIDKSALGDLSAYLQLLK